MVNFKRLLSSFKFAAKGIIYALKNEQNFRIFIVAGVIVVFLMFVFDLDLWKKIGLIALICSLLVLELINTIFEKIIDILRPRIYSYVEVIKDMMAAAVLIASIGAAIIGTMIFYPYILALFK
ncbi:MAG: diacylglycerol kinase [Patescibacteria group bacterium]